MGREATAQCQWAKETGFCKVLLETNELILRGGLRRRIPRSNLRDVSVEKEILRFRAGEDEVSLQLGSELAEKWAKALLTPPPSLAQKMGISRASKLLLLGDIDSAELKAAIAEASEAGTRDRNADLILAQVNTLHELDLALDRLPSRPSNEAPLWIVYPKKAGSATGEIGVREALRSRGFIDTKVTSVSVELTGLRFIRRGCC